MTLKASPVAEGSMAMEEESLHAGIHEISLLSCLSGLQGFGPQGLGWGLPPRFALLKNYLDAFKGFTGQPHSPSAGFFLPLQTPQFNPGASEQCI